MRFLKDEVKSWRYLPAKGPLPGSFLAFEAWICYRTACPQLFPWGPKLSRASLAMEELGQADLEPLNQRQEGVWVEVGPPLSSAPPGASWERYSHLSRRLFSERIRARAKLVLGRLAFEPECRLCANGGGYWEDLGGQAHWRRLCEFLTERPVVDEVLASFQQEWKVKGGRLRFNELLGSIEVMRCAEEPQAPPQAPPEPQDAWAHYRPGSHVID